MNTEAMKQMLEALKPVALYKAHNGDDWPARQVAPVITALREALANEALDRMAENARELGLDYGVEQDLRVFAQIDAMKQRKALAEPPAQQEPVVLPCCGFTDARAVRWNFYNKVVQCHNCGQVYTSPPAQRTWVGLTDEEITDIWAESSPYYHEDDFARAIEAKLRSKNEDRN